MSESISSTSEFISNDGNDLNSLKDSTLHNSQLLDNKKKMKSTNGSKGVAPNNHEPDHVSEK